MVVLQQQDGVNDKVCVLPSFLIECVECEQGQSPPWHDDKFFHRSLLGWREKSRGYSFQGQEDCCCYEVGNIV